MQSTRGKTWRHQLFEGSPERTDPPGPAAPASPQPPAEVPRGSQRVWAFLCPNPTCDTELVVFPEYAGSTVECPTCGFSFICPRVVPLQIVPEADADGTASAARPFAPGARLAQRSTAAGPPRPSAAPPKPPPPPAPPPSETPKATPADLAAAMPEAQAKGGRAAEALADLAHTVGGTTTHGSGTGKREGQGTLEHPAASAAGSTSTAPSASPSSSAVGSDSASSAPASPAAGASTTHAGANDTALRALADATASADARKAKKRRGPKAGGVGARMASAAFEGDRRGAARVRVAGDGARARDALDEAARRRAALETPLSEGERQAARRQRMDLVVTWTVAAIISACLALAAFVTGVPDIGLGSLLFLGLAGARTWWVTRPKSGNQGPPGR